MFELSTSIQPFLIGFFVLAAVATGVAVATLARVAADVRQSRTASPVVALGARSTVAVGRAA
jgi:hypothetical protein